ISDYLPDYDNSTDDPRQCFKDHNIDERYLDIAASNRTSFQSLNLTAEDYVCLMYCKQKPFLNAIAENGFKLKDTPIKGLDGFDKSFTQSEMDLILKFDSECSTE
ncbi:hypothetical protein QAD02_006327, partial [Eretmocerus hayati]